MLADAESFINAQAAATKAWQEESSNIRSTRSDLTDSYYEKYRVNNAAYDADRKTAWDLLAASDDKTLAFIGINCRCYEDEVLAVLPLLPATQKQLEDFAAEQGWCGYFDNLLEGAKEAGLFGEYHSLYSPAVAQLRSWFSLVVTSDRDLRTDLGRLVEAVVVEATGTPVDFPAF